MKKRKLISAVIAVCMLIGILPGVTFAIQHTEKEHNETYYYGDVNVDRTLNTGDAMYLLKYCANPQRYVIEPGTLSYTLADANVDTAINTGDASCVLRICAGMEVASEYNIMVLDTYTITYAAGIETQDTLILPASVEVEEESTYEITDFASLEGHDFLGWQADFDRCVYNVGHKFVMPAQDVVLTAVWDVMPSDAPTQEPTELPSEEPTEEPTPTQEPTEEPTEEPTDEPTEEPTQEPTEEPTQEPTEEPTEEPATAEISVVYYDCFNETSVGTYKQVIPKTTTALNKSNLNVPAGYRLDNQNFSAAVSVSNGIATPSTFNVNVYPYTTKDNVELKIIYTMNGFMKVQLNLAGNYILGNDINMSSVPNFMPFGWDWSNFDAEDTYFTGIFDGDGYKITDLHISYTIEWVSDTEYNMYKNVGLFSVNNGTIRNLSVYTRPFSGDTNYGVYGDINVGIIAGYNLTNIENCHTYGNIGSFDYVEEALGAVGGICGTNGVQGRVVQSSFEGGVEGFFYAGGIAGKCFGTISECYFAGGINWDVAPDFANEYTIRYIGGICGGEQDATITNCYVYLTYDVCGQAAIGGIAGWTKGGTISNSYVYGAEHIKFITDDTGGVYVGYAQQPPVMYGLYNYATQSGLPAEYDTSVWDMNGASNAALPDLINNRRGPRFHDAIA